MPVGPLSHRLAWLGLVVGLALFAPPRPSAHACRLGPTEVAPDDLAADASGPDGPTVVSIVKVRPSSKVGCQCRPECIDSVQIEFTLKTSAQRVYIEGDGKFFYVERAEETPDEAARFYLAPGLFTGGPPEFFRVSTVDDAGVVSQGTGAFYDPNESAQRR